MANKVTTKVKELSKRDKIIAVSAIVFVLLALIALIYNITVLARTNAQVRALEQQSYEIARQIQEAEDLFNFRNSPEFIEDFARRYLEMHGGSESVFIAR